MLWWTIQNLVITAILAGLVAVACKVHRLGPVVRHALWLVVLVKLLTPPLVFWPWAIRSPFLNPQSAEPTHTETATAIAAKTTPLSAAFVLRPRDSADMPIPADNPAGPADSPQLDPRDSDLMILPPIPAPPIAGSPLALPHAAAQVSAPPLPSRTIAPLPKTGAWSAALETIRRLRLRLLPCLAGIWIAGSLLFLLIQGARIGRMRRKLRASRPAGEALMGQAQVEAGRMRIRSPEIRLVSGIGSPAIWSLWRPLLIWPVQLPPNISQAAVSSLIVHEFAHLKRRDHWTGWLELAAGCAWWWNPLYWYARHQLRENSELACDAWVIAGCPRGNSGRRAYAEALLAVCECLSNHSNQRLTALPALGASTGGRRFLERRLAMILREQVPLRLPRLGLLSVGLLSLCAIPAWSQRAPGPAEGAPESPLQYIPASSPTTQPAAPQGVIIVERAPDTQPSAPRQAIIDRYIAAPGSTTHPA
jgi:beta-lactamase regulating signal transducer with metallopeptidase domain